MTEAIPVPEELAATLAMFFEEKGRAFAAALPGLAARFLDHWGLRPDGPAMHGMCALVLPVVRTADATPAVLKLQILDDESAGEPVALRVWDGDGAVRLLDHDPETGSMLLERLDPARMLSHEPDTHAAILVIARLLAHLTATPAPPGLRRLADIAADMLDRTPPCWPASRTPLTAACSRTARRRSARSWPNPATGSSTGTCTSTTSWAPTAPPGSPSTPSPSPATPPSTSGRP